MSRSLYLAALVAIAAPVAAPAREVPFFFKAGDRIVFLGDSITEQYQYSNYLELYLTTRMPEAKFTFLNAGIGGDTAEGGARRFQQHVLDEKPTAITINFGMNDGGYGKFNEDRNKVFREKTAEMLKAAKAAGVRVALCSPNAVDPRVKSNGPEYFETQKQFYAPLKEIAAEHGAVYAEQYGVTRAAIEQMIKDDPTADKAKPYYDGFHTSPPGAMLMAHAILTQLQAPALVSSVAITNGEAKTEYCTVSDLTVTDSGVSFTRLDQALPLPLQEDWLSMLPYMNELNDLNLYTLQVTGLKAGNYDVQIDGVTVQSTTAEALAKGINLGNLRKGPIFEHAQQVFQAITQKNFVNMQRFRGTILTNPPQWIAKDTRELWNRDKLAQSQKLLAEIEKQQAQVWKLAMPKEHKFAVVASK
jgi:lysophospholipase L1-like esterase